MSLISPTFQWLTILAAIVVSVAVVLALNRIPGPRPVRVMSRIAMG